MNFTVAVIIPVYNAERWIAQCIESVLKQTHQAQEIIAVNDGFTDASLKILQRYGSQIQVVTQPNSGAASARNLGARYAKSDWLAFIDSDDIWEPTKLEKQIQVLKTAPQAIGAYCSKRWIDAEGNVIDPNDAVRGCWASGEIFIPLVLGRTVNAFSPSQAILRKDLFFKCGGFPESQRHAEYYSLWIKLSLEGPILFHAEPLVSYRRHKESVSREIDSDFYRLESRFQTLTLIYQNCKAMLTQQQLFILQQELFETALAYGYHCRKQGLKSLAKDAYLKALTLDKVSLSAWRGLTLSLIQTWDK